MAETSGVRNRVFKMNDSSSPPDFRLQIMNQAMVRTFLTMKRDSTMKKALKIYAERNFLEYKTMKFFINGERFNHHKTPIQLGLEDGVEIEAMVEQSGGAH